MIEPDTAHDGGVLPRECELNSVLRAIGLEIPRERTQRFRLNKRAFAP
jgi:hypothetical protein